MVDLPNERSSHFQPTLRGAGIAVTAVMAFMFVVLSFYPVDVQPGTHAWNSLWLILGMLALAIVSWLDDVRGVAPLIRLIIHALVVVVLLETVFEGRTVFQGLNVWLDHSSMLGYGLSTYLILWMA